MAIMNRRILKTSRWVLVAIALMYGVYLTKTAMGVNISKRYSASWVFKVPLEPLQSHKSELCDDFQTLCTIHHKVRNKVNRQVNRIRRAV
jgi:hypothetical protein